MEERTCKWWNWIFSLFLWGVEEALTECVRNWWSPELMRAVVMSTVMSRTSVTPIKMKLSPSGKASFGGLSANVDSVWQNLSTTVYSFRMTALWDWSSTETSYYDYLNLLTCSAVYNKPGSLTQMHEINILHQREHRVPLLAFLYVCLFFLHSFTILVRPIPEAVKSVADF